MLPKTFSLCALIFSSVACAAAKTITPGRYRIVSGNSGLLPIIASRNALVRDPGFDQDLVVSDIYITPGSDQWDVIPADDRGSHVFIQNVAFSTYLKAEVSSVKTGTKEEATRFFTTDAKNAPNQVYIYANSGEVWTIPRTSLLTNPVTVQHVVSDSGIEQLWNFIKV